jgi:hypothetical protein
MLSPDLDLQPLGTARLNPRTIGRTLCSFDAPGSLYTQCGANVTPDESMRRSVDPNKFLSVNIHIPPTSSGRSAAVGAVPFSMPSAIPNIAKAYGGYVIIYLNAMRDRFDSSTESVSVG